MLPDAGASATSPRVGLAGVRLVFGLRLVGRVLVSLALCRCGRLFPSPLGSAIVLDAPRAFGSAIRGLLGFGGKSNSSGPCLGLGVSDESRAGFPTAILDPDGAVFCNDFDPLRPPPVGSQTLVWRCSPYPVFSLGHTRTAAPAWVRLLRLAWFAWACWHKGGPLCAFRCAGFALRQRSVAPGAR